MARTAAAASVGRSRSAGAVKGAQLAARTTPPVAISDRRRPDDAASERCRTLRPSVTGGGRGCEAMPASRLGDRLAQLQQVPRAPSARVGVPAEGGHPARLRTAGIRACRPDSTDGVRGTWPSCVPERAGITNGPVGRLRWRASLDFSRRQSMVGGRWDTWKRYGRPGRAMAGVSDPARREGGGPLRLVRVTTGDWRSASQRPLHADTDSPTTRTASPAGGRPAPPALGRRAGTREEPVRCRCRRAGRHFPVRRRRQFGDDGCRRRRHEPDDREDSPDCSDDHQDDADGLEVEPMLVTVGREREIENRAHGESYDTRYQACCHGLLLPVNPETLSDLVVSRRADGPKHPIWKISRNGPTGTGRHGGLPVRR